MPPSSPPPRTPCTTLIIVLVLVAIVFDALGEHGRGSLTAVSLPEPPTVPRCYRHPDREGGRSCTRCGKPACSDCLVQAAVGSHCLDCAKAARPDVKTRAQLLNSRQLTPVT